ncbi:nucleotidyltransferase domain-containing protein [Marispirochaeta sp.]|uniref:nucleotidyltransferase domain-containing protein n=1 Tax=Marispirochaeta sp. TaxID=2038653 RepID=UPI0029C98A13|nr:nucleotidyltransferase domain-containing protein [Marispirochaeta sp.]
MKYYNVMTVEKAYIKEILENLSTLNLKKVLLFGSYASGHQTEDSDIDLLVVLDENYQPSTYDEWLEIKMKVRRLLREINNNVGIDLLVYTIPQYEQLLNNMNSFLKEIHENGKVIYEKAS